MTRKKKVLLPQWMVALYGHLPLMLKLLNKNQDQVQDLNQVIAFFIPLLNRTIFGGVFYKEWLRAVEVTLSF